MIGSSDLGKLSSNANRCNIGFLPKSHRKEELSMRRKTSTKPHQQRRSRIRFTTALLALVGLIAITWRAPNTANAQTPEATNPNATILIKFKERISPPQQENSRPSNHINKKYLGIPDVDILLNTYHAKSIRPTYGLTAANQTASKTLGLDRWYEISLPTNTNTRTFACQLRKLNEIEIAEIPAIGSTTQTIPDDPFFDRQYTLHNTGQIINNRAGKPDADLDAPEAWNIHTGNSLVTVAVIDTGVDSHADYFDRLLPGWNTVQHNDNTKDDCPHGTHVAGIIAAKGNNGLGVAGVNWSANILPVRVLDGCFGTTTQSAEGIIWATDHGAEVANISLEFYTFSQFLKDAADYAHHNNVLLVAAAGNSNGRRVVYPAAFENVIAVSATGNTDEFESFSNFGPEIELAAPGRDIFSTWVGGTYTWLAGTSSASPYVTGTASLIKSFAPSLTNDEIHQILIHSADDLGPPGRDEQFGFGRINTDTAVRLTIQSSNQIVLFANNLVAGSTATLRAENATTDKPVFFLYSFTGFENTYIQRLNITLNLTQPKLAGYTFADSAGTASIEQHIPRKTRGRTVYLQAAQKKRPSQLIKTKIQK